MPKVIWGGRKTQLLFRKLKIFCSFAVLLLVSCGEDVSHISSDVVFTQDIPTENRARKVNSAENEKEKTILGRKRKNPYELENMKKASKKVKGNNSKDLVATHRYIKFIPTTQEHLAALDDYELKQQVALFDFPLEYEVLEQGRKYKDDAVLDQLYTYQYASVPVDKALPNVPHEVVSMLHIAPYNDDVTTEAFIQVKEKHKRFENGLILPPDDGGGGGGGTNYNACGCPVPAGTSFPAGCVRVENDEGANNPWPGVEVAMIRVKDDWFSSDIVMTNTQGCWHVDRSYSNYVWVWVEFKNNNVKIRGVHGNNVQDAVVIVDDYVDRFNDPPFNNIWVDYNRSVNDNDGIGRKYWACAHTLNTINRYRTNAAADGVPLPRQGLNVHIQSTDGEASTPMLQGTLNWQNVAILGIFGVAGSIYSAVFAPDITMQYGEGDFAFAFNATMFHELGHASHYSIVGESYWSDYRNHIINNFGYGTFPNFQHGSNPPLVALGEALGNYTGWKYGSAAGEKFENNFIPAGLCFDLEDDDNFDLVIDPNNNANVALDRVRGFTPAMIFGAQGTNVTTLQLFRVRLQNQSLNQTPNTLVDYNNLFNVYDVFN
jgi:hypothetical protein